MHIVKIRDFTSKEALIVLSEPLGQIDPINFKSQKGRRALGLFDTAFDRHVSKNLRYNRRTNVLSNDDESSLSRPSDPSQWEYCEYGESIRNLFHHVWCNAIRDANILYGILF